MTTKLSSSNSIWNFLYSIDPKGNGTCELSFIHIKETADLRPIGTDRDPDFDLYIKKIDCKLNIPRDPPSSASEPPPHHRPRPDGYDKPRPDYDKPRPNGYEKPKPDYDKPRPDYEKPRPNYDKPRPDYDRPRPDGYEKPRPDYGHEGHKPDYLFGHDNRPKPDPRPNER